jgi:hypothetical protein
MLFQLFFSTPTVVFDISYMVHMSDVVIVVYVCACVHMTSYTHIYIYLCVCVCFAWELGHVLHLDNIGTLNSQDYDAKKYMG